MTIVASVGSAAEDSAIELTIKDHKFDPPILTLPTSRPVKITVKNLDGAAEEVESKDLGWPVQRKRIGKSIEVE